MNNNSLNEVKVTGTVASKVNKSNLKDGSFICSFIIKLDERKIHIPVKFIGKRPVEFEKGDHIWLKGELAALKNFKGEYELGINAKCYKVHSSTDCQKQLPKRQRNYQINQDLMDAVNDVFSNASLDDLD